MSKKYMYMFILSTYILIIFHKSLVPLHCISCEDLYNHSEPTELPQHPILSRHLIQIHHSLLVNTALSRLSCGV